MKESILQACDDIKNDVEDIIADIDKLNTLDITISCNGNEIPTINIYKGYEKFIKVTDKIEGALMDG